MYKEQTKNNKILKQNKEGRKEEVETNREGY